MSLSDSLGYDVLFVSYGTVYHFRDFHSACTVLRFRCVIESIYKAEDLA